MSDTTTRKKYSTDVTGDQWTIIEPMASCQWDMLPHDLVAMSTAYDYFTK